LVIDGNGQARNHLPMKSAVTRRDMIKGSVAFAAIAFAHYPLATFGFGDPEDGAELVPFTDKQAGTNGIKWEDLKSWITPNDQVYRVQHYNTPKIDAATWHLEIGGLVRKPRQFTLNDLKNRRRKTITATLECSGNSNSSGFMGAIANVRWTGTPLAPLLKECEPYKRGIEVAFFGTDTAKDELKKIEYTANFSRGLHISDAMRDDILLCYEMNNEPLSVSHGAPVRLVVPGWFGIAWVKWLSRIEVLDRRIMGKYMAREYVTLRAEDRDDKIIFRETSIGPVLVKSIAARALRLRDGTWRIQGAAWSDGTPLVKVELKIDDGPWQPVTLDRKNRSKYCWTFWNYDWKKPEAGEHTLVSRATDAEGREQPTADDPKIRLKKTYWEANQQWPRTIKV
jgi:DMSO/TMAO reductase YedYZ molybdopterin-dependent catalytic subunit